MREWHYLIEVEETYFPNSNDYILLWKLEVLDTYQRRGYAKQLLNFAKENKNQLKLLLEITQRILLKQGFKDVETKILRARHLNMESIMS